MKKNVLINQEQNRFTFSAEHEKGILILKQYIHPEIVICDLDANSTILADSTHINNSQGNSGYQGSKSSGSWDDEE